MSENRPRLCAAAAASLALCLALAVSGPAAAKKKGKKKSGGNPATVTKATGALITDYTVAPAKPLDTVFDLGSKAFKGRVVSDVNITVQTTGNVAGAANDLTARLRSPSGRSVQLFTAVGGSQASIGPLTLDDDTPTLACNSTSVTTCTDTDPFATLIQPFAGRASGFADGAYVGLNRFYGVTMRGPWTLSVWDGPGGPGQTSTLTKAVLEVRAATAP
jgi:hypothetical protein